jgi:hypothetical protein
MPIILKAASAIKTDVKTASSHMNVWKAAEVSISPYIFQWLHNVTRGFWKF